MSCIWDCPKHSTFHSAMDMALPTVKSSTVGVVMSSRNHRQFKQNGSESTGEIERKVSLLASVVFDIQQREKEKKNFEKLEPKTVIFHVRQFDCRCASSNMSPICLHPLQNWRPHYSLTYLIWTIASSNKTTESTPETITSFDVIWRHVCFNIMNTDDSQVTWLVTWLDVILGANPVLLLFSLAPESTKFSIFSGRNLPFWGALFQLRSDVHWSVKSLHPFSNNSRSNPLQYSLSSNR